MKELLVYPAERCIMILVPKRRGEGYAKVPFGHHQGPLGNIEQAIGFDMWGLDGSLDVQTGYINPEDKDALLLKIMEPIASHYGMPWREVGKDEFFDKHPIQGAW